MKNWFKKVEFIELIILVMLAALIYLSVIVLVPKMAGP